MTLDQFKQGAAKCQADGRPDDVARALNATLAARGVKFVSDVPPGEFSRLWAAFQWHLQAYRLPG